MPAALPSFPVAPPDGPVAAAAPAERRLVMIGQDAAGGRLDKALADALSPLSRARIQALIAEGLVTAGGATIRDASLRVKPGQQFQVTLPAPRPARPEPQSIGLVILHEDDALLVIDKPAGLVVHPAAGHWDRTLVNALLAHCGPSLSGIGGVARPGIVHRLDKETSGLMVVAKTDAAHAALSAQFADRTLSRDYLAVVRGVPAPASGTIDAAIGRSPVNRKRMAVRPQGGKPARTRYRLLRVLGRATESAASLVECKLETGRTHQIRVHMASVGHPLIGDRLYGGPALGFPRQALHAARLRLRHPASGAELQFEAALPRDLAELISRLESL